MTQHLSPTFNYSNSHCEFCLTLANIRQNLVILGNLPTLFNIIEWKWSDRRPLYDIDYACFCLNCNSVVWFILKIRFERWVFRTLILIWEDFLKLIVNLGIRQISTRILTFNRIEFWIGHQWLMKMQFKNFHKYSWYIVCTKYTALIYLNNWNHLPEINRLFIYSGFLLIRL